MSKYRCEIDIAFVNEADAIAFLNHIEGIKTIPYSPTGSETIPLFRKCKKSKETYDANDAMEITDVDFDGPVISH